MISFCCLVLDRFSHWKQLPASAGNGMMKAVNQNIEVMGHEIKPMSWKTLKQWCALVSFSWESGDHSLWLCPYKWSLSHWTIWQFLNIPIWSNAALSNKIVEKGLLVWFWSCLTSEATSHDSFFFLWLLRDPSEQSVLVKERKWLCLLSCLPQNQDIMTRSTYTLTLCHY